MKRIKRVILPIVALVFISSIAQATVSYTVTTKHRGNMGDQAIVIAQLDFSGTYTTDGFSLTPSSVGLSTINSVSFVNYSGYTFAWDRDNAKVKIFNDVAPIVQYVSSTSGTMVPVHINASGALFAVFTDTTGHSIESSTIGLGELANGESLASFSTVEVVLTGY